MASLLNFNRPSEIICIDVTVKLTVCGHVETDRRPQLLLIKRKLNIGPRNVCNRFSKSILIMWTTVRNDWIFLFLFFFGSIGDRIKNNATDSRTTLCWPHHTRSPTHHTIQFSFTCRETDHLTPTTFDQLIHLSIDIISRKNKHLGGKFIYNFYHPFMWRLPICHMKYYTWSVNIPFNAISIHKVGNIVENIRKGYNS